MCASFRGSLAYLSNFHPAPVVMDKIYYPTAEHAFVAFKTNDMTIRKQIADLPTPGAAKRFGRSVVLVEQWDGVKIACMRNVLRAKFTQNPGLGRQLMREDPTNLVERNNWHDNFWGICECAKCGAGKNMLGTLLFELQRSLKDFPDDLKQSPQKEDEGVDQFSSSNSDSAEVNTSHGDSAMVNCFCTKPAKYYDADRNKYACTIDHMTVAGEAHDAVADLPIINTARYVPLSEYFHTEVRDYEAERVREILANTGPDLLPDGKPARCTTPHRNANTAHTQAKIGSERTSVEWGVFRCWSGHFTFHFLAVPSSINGKTVYARTKYVPAKLIPVAGQEYPSEIPECQPRIRGLLNIEARRRFTCITAYQQRKMVWPTPDPSFNGEKTIAAYASLRSARHLARVTSRANPTQIVYLAVSNKQDNPKPYCVFYREVPHPNMDIPATYLNGCETLHRDAETMKLFRDQALLPLYSVTYIDADDNTFSQTVHAASEDEAEEIALQTAISKNGYLVTVAGIHVKEVKQMTTGTDETTFGLHEETINLMQEWNLSRSDTKSPDRTPSAKNRNFGYPKKDNPRNIEQVADPTIQLGRSVKDRNASIRWNRLTPEQQQAELQAIAQYQRDFPHGDSMDGKDRAMLKQA